MASDLAIDLQDVAKTYRGKVKALRGIEMRVAPGEIFGLLGPNGAGKSTLVKILMTVIRPSRCSGTLLNRRVGHKATLRRVGYLPEHHNFPGYLTGAQILDYYGALAKVGRRDRRKKSAELLELVGMSDWAKKKVKSYSKGMRQRIGLANAMINDPDLIVLDEPTDGVDPVGRRDIRNVLVRLKEDGKTVFVNSHLLSELEMVCDRVAILVQGVVAQQGTIEDLTRDSRRYEITIEGNTPAWSESSEDVQVRSLENRTVLTVMHDDPAPIQGLIDRLRSDGRTITSVKPVRESLEDLFMRAVVDPETGETLAPGAANEKHKGSGRKRRDA